MKLAISIKPHGVLANEQVVEIRRADDDALLAVVFPTADIAGNAIIKVMSKHMVRATRDDGYPPEISVILKFSHLKFSM